MQMTSLITAIKATAARLRAGATYQWGHYGQCNCGHLAQTITNLSPGQIHRLAQQRDGEWRDQAAAFKRDDIGSGNGGAVAPDERETERCDTTGMRLDVVLRRMLAAGLSLDDIIHLETLSDPAVLARLPGERHYLQQNSRDDLILYLETWAALLSERAASAPRATANTVADGRAA